MEQRGLLRRGVLRVLLPRHGRPLQPRPGLQRPILAPSTQEPPPRPPRGQDSGQAEEEMK